jgi:hypothetical protein
MKKRNQIRLVMLFPAVMLGSFLFSFAHGCWASFLLSGDASQATATVTNERSHGVVDYTYVAAGNRYVGHSQRSSETYPGPPVGGEARVYFSTSHPWLSSLRAPTFPPSLSRILLMIIPLSMEFLIVMTIIDPKGKWALQTGLKEND